MLDKEAFYPEFKLKDLTLVQMLDWKLLERVSLLRCELVSLLEMLVETKVEGFSEYSTILALIFSLEVWLLVGQLLKTEVCGLVSTGSVDLSLRYTSFDNLSSSLIYLLRLEL